MAKFLSNINLETANDIQFKTTAGANAGKISQTGDDLVISNAVGDILLGNGSDDVYIGDGTNAVDIRFEQNMAIFADSSSTRTLTLGGSNTNLVLETPTINGSVTLPATTINSKMTFGTNAGYILFDYEPTTASGEYSSEVPLLRVDRSGTELTILSRVSNNGGVILGNDDGVAILAGDVKSTIYNNLNLSAEEVVIAAEGGWRSYSFPSNTTDWSNRNEFRFYGADSTAANNGLYIGDGGSTQFIDLSRNLTVNNITAAGNINNINEKVGTNVYIRNYELSTGDAGGSFLIGKIEHSSSTDGAISATVHFAYDYGTTTNNCTLHFNFAQRTGTARGTWWYEADDQEIAIDRVHARLIDDGSGNMYVWITCLDYSVAYVEVRHRFSSNFPASGTLTAASITSGTTLFDTANDPTAEMHIGTLYAHGSIIKNGGSSGDFLKADGSTDSNTYSTATGVADNADVTPSWVPANDPSYLTSQTSHSDVLVDGDFTGQGFMKRGSSAGSYSIDTNTYSTATGVANNADVTPSWVPANDPNYLTSETSHSDVLVDGDFSSAGFMKTDGSGNYSIDTNTYITSQRAISSTPTDGATTTAISSDWAFDNVKTAVPSGAVFTDTVNTLSIGTGANDAMAGNTSIPTDFVSKASGGTFSGDVAGNNNMLSSFFLPQNPEGSHVKAPWFFNDMAYSRLRGATISVTVNGGSAPGNTEIDAMFDAATGFWNMSTSGVTSVVIEMTNPPKTMYHGAHYGVTFGNSHWRAKNVDIDTYYSSAYQEVVSITGNTKEFIYGTKNSSGNAVSKIKWTFSDFNTTSMRIVSLFAYNYNATGMPSLYLAKDGGEMFGAIDMNSNKITELATPTNSSDAATKSYVDNAVISDTNTTYSISCVDGANTDEEIIRLTDSGSGTDDVVLEAGTGLSIARSSDKITFTNTISAETYTQHEDITAASSNLNNSGRTYIQDITLDDNGHVTGVATATETVTNTDTNKFLSSITKPANSNALQFGVTNGSTVSFTFGSNAYNSTTIPTGNAAIDWSVSGEEAVIHSSYYTDTVYTHPSYSTTNTGSLTGANVVSQISTNSTGHVTALATRTLSLSDLGFSGNSAANCVLNASQTLTNKTIDADNNTISDLVVSNFKSSAVVIESEGISSNDNDTTIPTSAAVKDYVDNNSSSANYYLDGISKSSNTLTFSVNGATDQTYTFGSNAFTSTAIPSISGLATETYVDTAEADAISAAATAAAGLYVPDTGTTTIGGTKTFTGSLILDDGVGSSPTMRFMNADDDEVSIFCNPTGKMKFQQKLVGTSNVVRATLDENGLHVDNGLKVGTGATITTIEDNDSLGTSDTKLATQGNIKAYVDNAVSSAGGGTMSNFTVRDDGGNDHQIDQGEYIQFDGVNCTFNRTTNPATNNSSTPLVMTVEVPKGKDENDFLICGNDVADDDFIRINGSVVEGRSASQVLSDIGAQAAGSYLTSETSHADVVVDGDFTSEGLIKRGSSAGSYSIVADDSSNWNTAYGWGDHGSAGYLTSVATSNIGANAVTLAKIKNLSKGRIIVGNSSNLTDELPVGTVGHVLTVQSGSTLGWSAASGGSSYSLPTSSTSTLGGVKLGSDTQLTQSYNAGGAGTSNRVYPVQLNSSNQMGVNVPWSNSERGAGAMLDVDGSGDLEVDLTEATSATIVADDELIFLDADGGKGHRGGVGDLAAALTDTTGGLTTSSGIIKVNTGAGISIDSNKVKVLLNPTNTGLQLDQTAGLSVKVATNGGIAVDAADALTLNGDITAIDTLYNAALHVGYGSSDMHLDFSPGTGSGSVKMFDGTNERFRFQYEGTFHAAGDVKAYSTTITSDRKLKKNIRTLDQYGLKEVLKLKPVMYDWKDELRGNNNIGFIAQDVQEVIPELVGESVLLNGEEGETKLGVEYNKMIAVLTNAIQEQQKQIEELKKLVNGNTN